LKSCVFSVDVEENGTLPGGYRSVANTRIILNMLREYKATATFFVVGKVVEDSPDLLREITDQGHEIGYHGYDHTPLTNMSPAEFRVDLEKGLNLLNDHLFQDIRGFRAPCFSMTPSTLWAIDLLKEYGFTYDSSISPASIRPLYGYPSAPLIPYFHHNGLLEFPCNTLNVLGQTFMFSGGAYFRFLPYFVFDFFSKCFKRAKNQAIPIFYFHPWELDVIPPLPGTPLVWRIRSFYGRKSVVPKLHKLLRSNRYSSFRDSILSESLNARYKRP